MLYVYRLTLLIGCVLSLTSCSKNEDDPEEPIQYTKATVTYKTINNVDPNLLSLDIYHFDEPTELKPVVVYVHGGAWAIGDKANSIGNKKALFSSLEYIFISINYRLSPSTFSTDPSRIKFPAHNEDVADAVKWIYDNVDDYGVTKTK